MTKIFKKNLSNKFPTKDITLDDKKNKLPLSTSNKKRIVDIGGGIIFGEKKIPVIAGPNGVESHKLMVEVAKSLVNNNLKIIRGHAYKPLTFPYRSKYYKESKSEGMDIMDDIKKSYNLKVVTEVTEIKYLDIICEAADILQIGSRNMQNLALL